MFTLLSRLTTRKASTRGHGRKAKTNSTLTVETLDKRRMLTGFDYSTLGIPGMRSDGSLFGSGSSSYTIPSSWSMPTYSTYGSGSSSYTSPYANTYGQGSSFFQPFTTTAKPNYSTSDFFDTYSYFSPTSSSLGSSSFLTPTYSSYSPTSSWFSSSNVYTTRPGSSYYNTYSPMSYSSYSPYGSSYVYTTRPDSAYFGTYAPSAYSSYSGGSVGSYTSAITGLQSSYNELQRLNNQLVSMGGTPVTIPGSVNDTLNSFYSGSTSNPFSGSGNSSSSLSNGTVTTITDLSTLKNAPPGVYMHGGTSFRWDGKGTSGSAGAVWVQPNGSVFDIGPSTITQTAGSRGVISSNTKQASKVVTTPRPAAKPVAAPVRSFASTTPRRR